MLRPSQRGLGLVIILLVVIALVATACGSTGPTGPIGSSGSKGATGDNGAVGPKGPAGNQGAAGVKGAAGDKGPVGVQGNPGATYPLNVIVVPTGVKTSVQPATVTAGARQPKVTLYGTGFPSKTLIMADVVQADGSLVSLGWVSVPTVTTDESGAFKVDVQAAAGVTLTATTYSLRVASLSGPAISVPIIIK